MPGEGAKSRGLVQVIPRIGMVALVCGGLAVSAFSESVGLSPDSVQTDKRPGFGPYDTVMVKNLTEAALRIDSVTIRFLDGGANPNPNDFIACKTCAWDSLTHYVYRGWTYGMTEIHSLRYVQDSLFMLQDSKGKPVGFALQPLDSLPFSLDYPINCPICGRMPAFPQATRYRFTFYASDGSSAVLEVKVGSTTGIAATRPRTQRAAFSNKMDLLGRKPSSKSIPGRH